MKVPESLLRLPFILQKISPESISLTALAAALSTATFIVCFDFFSDLELQSFLWLLLAIATLTAMKLAADWNRAKIGLWLAVCELANWLVFSVSRDVLPNCRPTLCGISSLLLLCCGRSCLRLTQAQLQLFFLKHVLFWMLAGEEHTVETAKSFLPLVLMFAACLLTSNSSESTPAELDGDSLRYFLDRLFCGVALIRSDEILFANSTMVQFLRTEDISDMKRKLREVPGLSMKLRRFSSLDAEWEHFGTFPLGEKLFEWIGCKAREKGAPVVIVICREKHEEKVAEDKATKSELIRSMSHELKTPINCIMHMSEELISAAEISSSGGEKCQIISSYCHFMSYLINDMVDYSEFVSGSRIALRRSKVHLASLISKCVEMVSVFAEAKKLKVLSSVDTHISEFIVTDESRLVQVILNLLSNAIKYTLKGTVKLVAVGVSPRKIKIIIEDSGIGIGTERMKTLFQSGKGGKTLATEGIGLVLANTIAHELGFEDIQVASEVGHGTTCSFYVYTQDVNPFEATPYLSPISPMMDVGETDRHQYAPVFRTSGFLSFRKCKPADILLVDDYPFNRLVVKSILLKEDLTVHEAENGQAAIEMVQKLHSHQLNYRLILMDIDMPILDGIKTMEKLSAMRLADPQLIIPPVVGHSAFTSDADVEKILATGMQGFIPKPFIKSSAIELIRKLLLPSYK